LAGRILPLTTTTNERRNWLRDTANKSGTVACGVHNDFRAHLTHGVSVDVAPKRSYRSGAPMFAP